MVATEAFYVANIDAKPFHDEDESLIKHAYFLEDGWKVCGSANIHFPSVVIGSDRKPLRLIIKREDHDTKLEIWFPNRIKYRLKKLESMEPATVHACVDCSTLLPVEARLEFVEKYF